MRTLNTPPEVLLTRILDALDSELVAASDEEITQAAQDLGMNLKMKGSAAFLGLRYPAPGDVSALLGPQDIEKIRLEMQRVQAAVARKPGA